MNCKVSIVMAGGSGSRLGGVNKPLIDLCGKPMIEHIISKALKLCNYVVLAISSRTLKGLSKYCREVGIDCVITSGIDYVKDLWILVNALRKPVLVLPSDTPFVSIGSLELVLDLSNECPYSVTTVSIECKDFVGISVFKGEGSYWCTICVPQSLEFLNVNTPKDLSLARGLCHEDSWWSA